MKIEDYLHLYLGSEIRILNTLTSEWSTWRKMTLRDCELVTIHGLKFQLSLRRLDDMTEAEAKELESLTGGTPMQNIGTVYFQFSTERFLWVLKQSFDLFGLIESGLAIDKTKI